MNKQNVLIFKLPELFNILNELKNHLDFVIHLIVKKDELLEFKKTNTGSYLILTNSENELKEEKSQLILNKFPDTIHSIIEKININLLKHKYSEQSDILIGNYSIDINSRLIKKNYENLKLTEREIEIILFLQNSKEPQSIEKLQKEVWGHSFDLETHTVETHIYRLRKKISEKFNDSSFINSTKKGYKIK
ncbi:winged helix-turn-helix domain-containing protein [Candidatus Pelagibacter sp.]|nr:winged helix-turn-helix domain-containing protein [Candidatus Pelagibacter sp.]